MQYPYYFKSLYSFYIKKHFTARFPLVTLKSVKTFALVFNLSGKLYVEFWENSNNHGDYHIRQILFITYIGPSQVCERKFQSNQRERRRRRRKTVRPPDLWLIDNIVTEKMARHFPQKLRNSFICQNDFFLETHFFAFYGYLKNVFCKTFSFCAKWFCKICEEGH